MPKPTIRVSPARAAAFEILERVENTSAHSDDQLHGPRLNALSQADRNLATTLVLGVLRWQIALDARIRPLLQRPDPLPSPVATALRLGAFQLAHLDRIPAHAALSESVELVREAGHPHAAGMANAILRKLSVTPVPSPKLYEATPALAERLGHPAWLVERWVKHYGRAAAAAICEYDQQEPRPGDLFETAAIAAESAETSPRLPRLDDGSRLVAELAAAAQPAASRIWDCCAAPGGKTLFLGQRHPEASLLATDVNPRRLRSLEERLQREQPGSKTRTLEADAAKLPEAEGLFDLILCDVPCSGTGTLSRNPEIRHHLKPSDLGRQAMRQREILMAALSRLAPGGRLLYSTCSLEPEENEEVVAEVLARQEGVATLTVEPLLASLAQRGVTRADAVDLKPLVRDGYLRTLPGSGFQGDGFFAALFKRQ